MSTSIKKSGLTDRSMFSETQGEVKMEKDLLYVWFDVWQHLLIAEVPQAPISEEKITPPLAAYLIAHSMQMRHLFEQKKACLCDPFERGSLPYAGFSPQCTCFTAS